MTKYSVAIIKNNFAEPAVCITKKALAQHIEANIQDDTIKAIMIVKIE